MMKKKIKMLLVAFLVLGLLPVRAMQRDSLVFSLLTCSPSDEVYALYGHTAIRCQNLTTGEDLTFNYGIFDFSTPGFALRFAQGACDYELGVIPYYYMAREYASRGSALYEQVLNLTAAEKERLLVNLMINAEPENRKYRYNFLYDNCTTRARDQIEAAIDGEVVYPDSGSRHTFREIIHQFNGNYPWAALGNDLCLGEEADRPVTLRQEMFAPFYFKNYLAQASVRMADGKTRPLVLSENVVEPDVTLAEPSPSVLTPGLVFWMLAVVVLAVGLLQWHRRRIYWGVDLLLMTVQGVAGLIIAGLFFFSEHPTVGTNWQVLLLNPMPLLLMPWVIWGAVKHRKIFIHKVRILWLTFFIVFSAFTTQDFTSVVVPLALALLIRSIGYEIDYRKNKTSYQ